jgi:Glyoxalase superfamily protein
VQAITGGLAATRLDQTSTFPSSIAYRPVPGQVHPQVDKPGRREKNLFHPTASGGREPPVSPAPRSRPGSSLEGKPTVKALATIPLLRIFDIDKAREFYIGFLGFALDWEHRFDENAPVYMQVSRGGCVLHLTEHHGDACPGSTVFVRVEGLESYHREITAKRYGMMRPGIERTFHDSMCMEVTDPFGNRIRFDQSLASATEP